MFDALFEIFRPILDFFSTFAKLISSLFVGLFEVFGILTQIPLVVTNLFDWLPFTIFSIVNVLFVIVVFFKIFGRE